MNVRSNEVVALRRRRGDSTFNLPKRGEFPRRAGVDGLAQRGQVAEGRGRDVATGVGALAGGAVGANVGSQYGGGYSQDVQRCAYTQDSGRPDYYDVTYKFRGYEHRVQTTAPPGPTILVNDNALDVLIAPATEAGKPAAVQLWPLTESFVVDAQVRTVAAGGPNVEVTGAGPGRVVVRGQIAVGARSVVRVLAADDPASFARTLFIETLRREGVAVRASPLREPQAELLERDAHTVGAWLATFERGGAAALAFEQSGGPPPPLGPRPRRG